MRRRSGVRSRTVLRLLMAGLVLTSPWPSLAADLVGTRPRVVDPVKAKAREAERQRLVAKLHGEAPKEADPPAMRNALEAPIFHRHDRR